MFATQISNDCYNCKMKMPPKTCQRMKKCMCVRKYYISIVSFDPPEVSKARELEIKEVSKEPMRRGSGS